MGEEERDVWERLPRHRWHTEETNVGRRTWECIPLGQKPPALDVARLERVLAIIAPDVYGAFRWIAHDAACDIAAEYARLAE